MLRNQRSWATRSLAALCIYTVGATVPAVAEDFNLTVRINLSGLAPEIREVWVDCAATGEPAPGFGISSGRPIGALVGTPVPVASGGTVDRTLTVQFNAFAGVDPRLAVAYTCSLRMRGLIGAREVVYTAEWEDASRTRQIMRQAAVPTATVMPSAPGSSPVVMVEGRF
jgi:hypothetical protein